MPMGKGTYGSKRGRPPKKKKGKSMPKKMGKKDIKNKLYDYESCQAR